MTVITCHTCGLTVKQEERRIVGCGCDPDAPTWCWIDPNGEPHGLSAARYTAWR